MHGAGLTRRWALRILGVPLLAGTFSVSAAALQTCHGTYTASSLGPLPSPLVVQGVTASDPDQAFGAQQLQAGMQAAGANFLGTPTVQMTLVLLNTMPAADIPTQGTIPLNGSTLVLSLTLANLRTYEIVWTALITCTVTTTDRAALAREIGMLIGQTLGGDFWQRRI